jgi:phosphate transport system substrate-binding protein
MKLKTNGRTVRFAAILVLAAASPAASLAQSLKGSGATFPAPIYKKWIADYRAANPNVKISYSAIGSGAGIKAMLEGTVDFAGTDDPLTNQQLATARSSRGSDVLHFPTAIGAIVPIYNVPGVNEDLNFTPEVLADIFMGKITRWNDPQIARHNPGVRLRPDPITVVHRQDGSGSTYIFTEFLSRFSPAWKSQVGSGTTVKWPVGINAKGNEGVVWLVENTWDTIGYAEYSYALNENVPHGNVGSPGRFIKPSPESVEAAAAAAIGSRYEGDLRISLLDAKGPNAYPISSLTWLLVPTKSKDAEKGKALHGALRWMLTEGQKSLEEMGYGKLPKAILDRSMELLKQVQ